MYCEFWFQPAPLCPATFPFQFAKLLSNAAEPGVGFRWRTVRRQRGACLSRTQRSCLLKSVMGVMDWARSCLKEFLSVLLIERNFVVTGWTAGLGMSSGHRTAMWSDVSPWSRQVERRRHSLCLWKTRSKRWPCLCVGSVTDWGWIFLICHAFSCDHLGFQSRC